MKIVGRALREPFTGRAWREWAYSLLSLPLAVLGLAAVLATCFVCVVGVLSTGVLLPLLPLALAANRGLGAAHRALARALLHWVIPAPPRPRHPRGLAGLVNRLTDAASWRSVGYLALRFPLGAVQFALGFAWWVYSVSFLLYPLLWQLQGRPRGDGTLQFAGLSLDTWPRALLVTAAGAVLLVAWPWVARGPLAVDRQLMARLLGPSATSLRLAHLAETREHAINEAAATLRRIERDLHDGAQARLVALGMKLDRAERRLDRGDPHHAKALLREARGETREIVRELRELVRGIHPPALDAGLEPALATLAARAPVPTTVRVAVAARPRAATETLLYFAAAELLTNACKHAEATRVAITVLGQDGSLRLQVTDDGRGGARLSGPQAGPGGAPGSSGLRGLAERARAADGRLHVDSPPGGPTTVTLELDE